jgi:DNA primase small subunit
VKKIFQPATPEERRRYYREEWDVKQIPKFIEEIGKREFGFDQVGKGPTDRYRVFRTSKILQRFMRYRAPFAAYCSVAFYEKPRKRDGWIKSELVFDVDAKDLPIRSCSCEGVCEICLDEAREVVLGLVDTLGGDLGLEDIHVIYSGRGYHIRALDESVMKMDSDVRSQVLKYIIGADIPESKYEYAGVTYNLEHFSIPFGYPKVFTERVKYVILHLTRDAEIENVDQRLLQDIIKNRNLIQEGEWGEFRSKIGRIRYKRFVEGVGKLNLSLVDAKVTIDLKRILRLPSSLHSMVSMKCMEVEDLENFDPFQEAVPKFVYERD